METSFLTALDHKNERTSEDLNEKKNKSIRGKLAAILAVIVLATGFGLGYWVRSAINESSESNVQMAPPVSSMSKLNSEIGICWSNSSSIESVMLAGASKNISGTFKERDVSSHFEFLVGSSEIKYGSNLKSTFSCVDARANNPILGTPGGDLAEFAMGMQVYFNSTGTPPQLDIVRQKFQSFLINQITEQRPFYYHTDDTRLRLVYRNLSVAFGRNVTILPQNTPSNASEREAWLRELSESYAQGCGHIRLMINSPSNYGLPNNFVIKSVIRVFYEEWWARTKAQKKIFDFAVKLGPLIGAAVAIVTNSGSSCSHASPKILPNAAGSTLFVYHPTAVAEFREKVLTPFFVSESQGKIVNSVSFFSGLTDLFTTQLTATLTYLAPANAVDLFSVKVKAE